MTGYTRSRDFPVTFELSPQPPGDQRAAFVVKLDPTGSIVYSLVLSGTSGNTEAYAIAVDGAGSAYITGETSAPDFPAAPGAFQEQRPAGQAVQSTDAFLAKISPSGASLLYSTYLGGAEDRCVGSVSGCVGSVTRANHESGRAIALDAEANVYVAGGSTARDFPVHPPGRSDHSEPGTGFIAKFSAASMDLEYSLRFGGGHIPAGHFGAPPMADMVRALVVGHDGAVYLAGETPGAGFAATVGVAQTAPGGGSPESPLDGFVAKLSADGLRFESATYLGGVMDETISGLALGAEGGIIVSMTEMQSTGRFPEAVANGRPVLVEMSPDASAIIRRQALPRGIGGGAIKRPGATGRLAIIGTGTRANALTLLTQGGPSGPAITAVTSAASFAATGAVSPGELITLFGAGLGPEEGAAFELENGRVPRELAGTRVFIGAISAPILYVREDQINAVVPFGLTPSERVPVEVQTVAGLARAYQAAVVQARPELFQLEARAAALNQDGTVNGPGNPAEPGSFVALFGTGGGAFSPPIQEGDVAGAPPSLLDLPVEARLDLTGALGSVELEVFYAGAAPSLVNGVFQINVRVPGSGSSFETRALITVGVGGVESDPLPLFVLH